MGDSTGLRHQPSDASQTATTLRQKIEKKSPIILATDPGAHHSRKASMKVQQSFISSYKDKIEHNWKLVENDPKWTLFDQEYVEKEEGKKYFRNENIICKQHQICKSFNEQVLQRKMGEGLGNPWK